MEDMLNKVSSSNTIMIIPHARAIYKFINLLSPFRVIIYLLVSTKFPVDPGKKKYLIFCFNKKSQYRVKKRYNVNFKINSFPVYGTISKLKEF
jgi:hypothetical protein